MAFTNAIWYNSDGEQIYYGTYDNSISSTHIFNCVGGSAGSWTDEDNGITSGKWRIYNDGTKEEYDTSGTYVTAIIPIPQNNVRIFCSAAASSSTTNKLPVVTFCLTDDTLQGSELYSGTATPPTLSASSYCLRGFRTYNGDWYACCGTTVSASVSGYSATFASNLKTAYEAMIAAAGTDDVYLYGVQYKIVVNSSIQQKANSVTLYYATSARLSIEASVTDDETGEEIEPTDTEEIESDTDSDTSDSDTSDSDSTDSDTTESDSTESDSTESDSTESDTTSTSSSVAGYDADSDGGYQGYYQSIYDYMAVAHPNTENWTAIHSADSSVGARTVTLTEDNYSEYLETWQFNALPLRAYNLIYKEWFRDENLIDSPPINKDDGVDDGTDYKLLKRAKRHDYFTAALPWTQKGDLVDISAALSATGDNADIGLAISASDVSGIPSAGAGTDGYRSFILRSDEYNQIPGYAPSDDVLALNAEPIVDTVATAPDGTVTVISPSNTLYNTTQLQLTGESIANILAQSMVTSFSINELREAFQIQRLLERDARSGTRYTEILRGHFGVISPDARLQRPEYLGGSTTMLNINTVAQTSSTNDTSPQGNLSAYGVMASRHNGFNKSFVEHGYIIGIVSIRADLTYQQGLHKLWTRQTRYDFYWPVLAHLGEQAVYNREIYFQNDSDVDEAVFGYQERWSEYRYFPSQITGLFRSSYKEPLDFWHLSQYFEELPKLNQDFIEENVPIERVIAVTSEPHFLLDVWFRSRTTRPMPTYSVPGLIDHF